VYTNKVAHRPELLICTSSLDFVRRTARQRRDIDRRNILSRREPFFLTPGLVE
jgi:hypothetical protein